MTRTWSLSLVRWGPPKTWEITQPTAVSRDLPDGNEGGQRRWLTELIRRPRFLYSFKNSNRTCLEVLHLLGLKQQAKDKGRRSWRPEDLPLLLGRLWLLDGLGMFRSESAPGDKDGQAGFGSEPILHGFTLKHNHQLTFVNVSMQNTDSWWRDEAISAIWSETSPWKLHLSRSFKHHFPVGLIICTLTFVAHFAPLEVEHHVVAGGGGQVELHREDRLFVHLPGADQVHPEH